MKITLFLLSAFALSTGVSMRAVTAGESAINSQVHHLLAAYSAKDLAAAMALADPDKVFVMGGDLAEICDTREKVEALLRDDFKLWANASFGEITILSIQAGDEFASAFFDVPFTMQRGSGRSDRLTIRFATVWRKNGEGWKLAQLLSATPSVGRSAREILQQISNPKPPAAK